MAFEFNNPLLYELREGSALDPHVPLSTTSVISNNKIVLTELPNEFEGVIISGYAESKSPSGLIATTFYCNYLNGILSFASSENGKTVTASYKGRGVIQIPAERIYTKSVDGSSTETFQQIADSVGNASTVLGNLNSSIATGNTTNSNLISSISSANITKTNLNDMNIIAIATEASLSSANVVASEATRVQNESARIINEGTRVNSEVARVSAENLRKSAEDIRIPAEVNRISAESARIIAENLRIAQNNNTINAENIRLSSEIIRESNEDVRIENEGIRESQEENRQNTYSTGYVKFKGVVTGIASLPASGNILGDTYQVIDDATTSNNAMWRYNGTIFEKSYVLDLTFAGGYGANDSQVFTATENQTLFTLTDFPYLVGVNQLMVYVAGIKQIIGVNYTETSTNSFTLTSGVVAGTKVEAFRSVPGGAGSLTTQEVENARVSSLGIGYANLKARLDDHDSNKVGVLANLNTSVKTDIVSAINEQLAETATSRNGIRGSFLKRLQAGEVTLIDTIGDSITAGNSATGAGADPVGQLIGTTGVREAFTTSPCWTNFFRNYIAANYPTITFFNKGIGGFSATSEGVTYRDSWISTNRDVIFVMFGTNDRADATTEAQFFTAIEDFCLQAEANCNTLIVMTAPPTLNDYYEDGTKNPVMNLTMEQIDKVITNVCIKNNWEHISFYREFLQFCTTSNTSLEALLQSSSNPLVLAGSHPINPGHLLMWKILQQKLGIVTNTHDWKTNLLPNQSGVDSDGVASAVLDLKDHEFSNLASNGNFVDATGWTPGNATLSVAGGVATLTGSGASKYVTLEHANFSAPLGSSKKVYVSGEIKVNDAHVSANLRMAISGVSGTTVEIGNYGQQTEDEYVPFSAVMETTANYASTAPYVYVLVEYADAATANGKTVNVRNVMVFNLETEFGAGSEPSSGAMDSLVGNHGGYITTTAQNLVAKYNAQKDKIAAMWINATETILNIIDDGDFPATTNWTPIGSTHSVASGVLSNIGDGSDTNCKDYNHTLAVVGASRKLYYFGTFEIDNSDRTSTRLRIVPRTGTVELTASVISVYSFTASTLPINTPTRISGVATTTAAFASPNVFSCYVLHTYSAAGTATGKTLKVQKLGFLDVTDIFSDGETDAEITAIMDLFVIDIKNGFVDIA